MTSTDARENNSSQLNEKGRNAVVTIVEAKARIIGGRAEQQDFVWTGHTKAGTRWGILSDGHGKDGAIFSVNGGKNLIHQYKRLKDQDLVFENAAKTAFSRTHELLLRQKAEEGLIGGSTAVLFDIDHWNNHVELKVAHAGDSKAALININTGKVIFETRDHSASDPVEIKGVIARGGKVEYNRVAGNIAVTRGLGDSYRGMTSEPETIVTVLSADKYLLVIGSDGFFNGLRKYMEAKGETDRSVLSYTLLHFKENGPYKSMDIITQDLANMAHEGFARKRLQKGKSLEEAYGDNISLIFSAIEVK